MTIFEAIVFGIIQGITEFLPVSSTAHLSIIPSIFGMNEPDRCTCIFLNCGTLIAILTFYWRDVLNAAIGGIDFVRRKETSNRQLFISLLISSLPVIIIGAVAELVFDFDINSMLIVGINLAALGLILLAVDRYPATLVQISLVNSVKVGIMQALSIIPGVSRLGICLIAMRHFRYSRWYAFKFSMLMSIPPVSGACALKLLKVATGKIVITNWIPLFWGTIASFAFGLLALYTMSIFFFFFLLKPIAIYRIMLGLYVIWKAL